MGEIAGHLMGVSWGGVKRNKGLRRLVTGRATKIRSLCSVGVLFLRPAQEVINTMLQGWEFRQDFVRDDSLTAFFGSIVSRINRLFTMAACLFQITS